jgi:3-phosphoshikimate 1-carboxyvinyltransferase
LNLTLHKPQAIISAVIELPGSKSISNRVLIIRSLSGLQFSIKNISNSDDTLHLIKALEQFQTNKVIDVGHAGTDMRFLTAFLAIKNGTYELTGSERLQQRPIKDLVDVLKDLGADISYKNKLGFPPLQIKGKQILGGNVKIKGDVSSQFISALLLIAPYFENGLSLEITSELVSKPYVTMTIEMMKSFGADVEWNENVIYVKPAPYSYSKPEYIVESDWSAASYYYSIVALSAANTQLTLRGLFKHSFQADSACDEIYKKFGIETVYHQDQAVITKTNVEQHRFIEYNFIECPDIAQTLVCNCVGLGIPFEFTGLQTLKVKETDRISALFNEFSKISIHLDVTENSISYSPIEKSALMSLLCVTTYNDHRMAMSFAPLCLVYSNIVIEDAEVVSKSYPLFWEHLKQIGIYQTSL